MAARSIWDSECLNCAIEFLIRVGRGKVSENLPLVPSLDGKCVYCGAELTDLDPRYQDGDKVVICHQCDGEARGEEHPCESCENLGYRLVHKEDELA